MQEITGWLLIIFGGSLYFAQIISSINFPLAQKLGLQEKSETSAPLLLRSERYTAYWDLLTLIWLPVAGYLMIINHYLWPILLLTGGAIYLDTVGREALKSLGFRHEGVKMGTAKEQRLFFLSYIVMMIMAIFAIIYSILHLKILLMS